MDHTEAPGDRRRPPGRHHRRQARLRDRCWSIVGDREGRGETAANPEKARNAEPGASEEEKTKRRGGYRGWRTTRGSLANVSQDVGCDECIDKRRGSFQ
jgi:hypothetical protein